MHILSFSPKKLDNQDLTFQAYKSQLFFPKSLKNDSKTSGIQYQEGPISKVNPSFFS